MITVRGVEKLSFKERETRTHEVDGRQEQRTIEVKRRHKKDIFRYSSPVFVFAMPMLNIGDY